MAAKDDLTLLQRIVQHRDQTAFHELFVSLKGEAYALAVRIAGQAAEGEEAVQKAFLDVWQHGKAYEVESGNVRIFVLDIVAHKALKRAARRWSRSTSEFKWAHAWAERGPSPAGSLPAEAAEQRELLTALGRTLERLPAQEHMLLTLRFGGGLSQQQIGAELGVSQRTISSRIQKALDFLKAELGQAGLAAAVSLGALEAALAEQFRNGIEAPAESAERMWERLETAQAKTASGAGASSTPLGQRYAAILAAGLLATAAYWGLINFLKGGSDPGQLQGTAAFAKTGQTPPLGVPGEGERIRWSFKDTPADALEILYGKPFLQPGAGLVIPPWRGRDGPISGGVGLRKEPLVPTAAAGEKAPAEDGIRDQVRSPRTPSNNSDINLEIKTSVIALVSHRFPRRPCTLRIEFRMGQPDSISECSIMWGQRTGACKFKKRSRRELPVPAGLNVVEVWFVDQFHWSMDASPTFERLSLKDRILSLGEYYGSYPSQQAVLLMSNIVLEAVECRELTAAEQSQLPAAPSIFLQEHQAEKSLNLKAATPSDR